MKIIDHVLTDRGSKYAVSGGPARTADDVQALLKELKRNKKFAKATHNSWALFRDEGGLKNDDGEGGAGMLILRTLEGAGLRDHLVVVTRWYGGTHLGGDRFRHVKEAVRVYLEALDS
jgi:putative IMPACT (imprinted ancient) family translation regulator